MKNQTRSKRKQVKLTDLSDFEGQQQGRKCFVVGAGPSLAFLKLSEIHNHVVISVNSSIMLMPWESGDPSGRFWISNDTLCLRWSYFWTDLHRSRCTKMVRNSWLPHIDKLEGFKFYVPRRDEYNLKRSDPGLCSVSSVPTSIDFALLLGCSEIYLLGVDQRMIQGNSHFWQFWNKKKWPQRKDKGRFFHPEQTHQLRVFDDNVRVFKSLQEYALSQGSKIFNCSSRSVLEVFPKITLEEALSEKP